MPQINIIQFKFADLILFSDCNCNAVGSNLNGACDENGVCSCKENFFGNKCSLCAPGYYGLPNCTTGK